MVNEALRLLRVFNDYKAKDLAVKLGISYSYLSEIEKGKKKPSLELINNYSKIFDIPPSTILFFSEKLSNNKNTFKSKVAKSIMDFLKSVEKEGRVESA